MNRTLVPAVLLAAASLIHAQPPVMRMTTPGLPVLPQLTQTSMAAGQVKDTLFAGTEKFAQGASESNEVTLDPDTMEMLGSKAEPAKEHSDLAKKMKLIVVRNYTYDKPGMYKMEDVEAFRKKLDDGTWNCSIRVRDKKESTDICSRLGPDHETREMVIISAEERELTFVHMIGNMSLDDLNKTAGKLQRR